jgi:uncharacterized delta-60 repeat protein
VTALSLSFQITFAQLAEADVSFGENGFIQQNMVNSNGNNLESELSSLILLPDGKIVSASTFHLHGTQNRYLLHQYNSDGSLNTSFGTGGFIQSEVDQVVKNVKMQSDGKFVIIGYEKSNMPDNYYVVRFNADGSADETFISDSPVSDYIGITALEIQKDDKILVTQVTGAIGERISKLIRYNADGTRDLAFGTNGEVLVSAGGWQVKPLDIVVQSNGKIVLAGDVGEYPNIDVGIIRYNSNGTLDAIFDGDGIKIFDFGSYENFRSLAVNTEGKIVFVEGVTLSDGQYGMRMIRLNSDGNYDSSFGNGGIQDVSTLFSNICSLKILGSSKILLSGTYQVTANPTPDTDPNPVGSAAGVLESNGNLDLTFGHDGFLKTILSGYRVLNNKIVVQSDGKIVMGITYCESWFSCHPHTVVLRYNPEQTLSNAESNINLAFLLYPNPVKEMITVDFTLQQPEVFSMDLYDINSRLISHLLKDQNFQAGFNSQKLNLPALLKGIYFLRISNGTNTTNIKLIK